MMEDKENQPINIVKNNETKENINLKTRKKVKGYCRFLRNVIKEKSKSLKEIIQKRFIKWRKDALKGKIKKTVMIRISVSKEKDPKSKYQISKANPKERSKSVNKNELKSFNINNLPKNITNLKVQKVDDFIKKGNKINTNKVNDVKTYNNIEIKSISNVNTNKDKNEKENTIYKKVNPSNKNEGNKVNNNNVIKIDLSKYNKKDNNSKNQINNQKATSIIKPEVNKLNKEHISKIPKPSQNIIKNKPQELNKKPISNTSNINIVYTSSTKKNNPNETNKKNENKNSTTKNYQTDIKEKMNKIKNKDNKTDLKDNIPKDLYKKYERNNQNNSRTINNIKIDLTKGNYTRQTFNNRHVKDNNSFTNPSYNDNKLQKIHLYNNNTYQRRNNDNTDNKSISNYSIKTDINIRNYNNNEDSLSVHSRPRRESNITNGDASFRKNSKGGRTTVIQYYSGQRRKYENYDNNTYDINKNKK